jgi:hypothetical protein
LVPSCHTDSQRQNNARDVDLEFESRHPTDERKPANSECKEEKKAF